MHGLDASFVVTGSAVDKVVAIDDCDHDVLKAHSLDDCGELLRLIRIRRFGIAKRLNTAKSATAGAFFSSDHERCRAARPAIILIRASSLFAHRVQAMVGNRVMRRIKNREALPIR
jgi:hypothetical protein